MLVSVLTSAADTGDFVHMGGLGWGMALIGFVAMISIVGLIVWAIVSSTRRPPDRIRLDGRARALLDERYAAGDIDRDEYLERKDDLER